MESSLENVLMTRHKKGMVSYIENYPGEFENAVQLAIADKQPYSNRAAWLLWSCMKKNDHRIKKHLDKLIKIIP